jgi:hypothetical protein
MTSERKKRSVIYTPTKEKFQEIVKSYNTLAEIIRHFGLGSGNYETLKARLKSDNIDYSHIKLGLDTNKYRGGPNKKDISEYLKKDTKIWGQQLKRRLLRENVLENKCSICDQGPEWNGKELVLQLDHINGINSDNRIENLRIICPNCHTQTSTFSGRNGGRANNNNCKVCGAKIAKKCSRCQKCHLTQLRRNQKTKISWPETNELIKLTSEFGFREIGRRLGVSDNAIRKRILSR